MALKRRLESYYLHEHCPPTGRDEYVEYLLSQSEEYKYARINVPSREYPLWEARQALGIAMLQEVAGNVDTVKVLPPLPKENLPGRFRQYSVTHAWEDTLVGNWDRILLIDNSFNLLKPEMRAFIKSHKGMKKGAVHMTQSFIVTAYHKEIENLRLVTSFSFEASKKELTYRPLLEFSTHDSSGKPPMEYVSLLDMVKTRQAYNMFRALRYRDEEVDEPKMLKRSLSPSPRRSRGSRQ